MTPFIELTRTFDSGFFRQFSNLFYSATTVTPAMKYSTTFKTREIAHNIRFAVAS